VRSPRIVSFGTSLSARGGWQVDLVARLAALFGLDAQIAIHAKPGANSDWGVESVAAVAALDADIVLIEFAINDASLLRGMSLARSRRNLISIVETLQAGAPERRLVLMTMNPALGLKRLIRPRLDSYYRICVQVATELGLEIADLRQSWTGFSQDQLRRAIPDGLHPLPDAASRVIIPRLVEVIAARQGETEFSGRRAGPAR